MVVESALGRLCVPVAMGSFDSIRILCRRFVDGDEHTDLSDMVYVNAVSACPPLTCPFLESMKTASSFRQTAVARAFKLLRIAIPEVTLPNVADTTFGVLFFESLDFVVVVRIRS